MRYNNEVLVDPSLINELNEATTESPEDLLIRCEEEDEDFDDLNTFSTTH